MLTSKPYLSKSRLISAWQCAKKLHLEKHHPELGDVSSQTESLFAKARDAVTGPLPLINVGAQCNKPYDCQFQSHCWPMDAD